MPTTAVKSALLIALAFAAPTVAAAHDAGTNAGQVPLGAPFCIVDPGSQMPITCGYFQFVDTGIVCFTAPCPSLELRFVEFERPEGNRAVVRPSLREWGPLKP